jgi:hypothetical protein
MSKVSYDEALDEMELMLRAVRAYPERLQPLAYQVADELEAKIRAIGEERLRQKELLSHQMAATQELLTLVEQGKKAARDLRGFVVMALGTTNPLLTQFGIAVRGRRRHRAPKKDPEPAGGGGLASS